MHMNGTVYFEKNYTKAFQSKRFISNFRREFLIIEKKERRRTGE